MQINFHLLFFLLVSFFVRQRWWRRPLLVSSAHDHICAPSDSTKILKSKWNAKHGPKWWAGDRERGREREWRVERSNDKIFCAHNKDKCCDGEANVVVVESGWAKHSRDFLIHFCRPPSYCVIIVISRTLWNVFVTTFCCIQCSMLWFSSLSVRLCLSDAGGNDHLTISAPISNTKHLNNISCLHSTDEQKRRYVWKCEEKKEKTQTKERDNATADERRNAHAMKTRTTNKRRSRRKKNERMKKKKKKEKKNDEQKNIFCRSSVFPLSLPFSLLSLLLSSRLVPLMFYISMKLLCKWNALFSFVHFILSSFPVTNFSVQVSSSLRCNTPSSPLTQHQRTLPHCRLSVVVPISRRSSKVLY